jgi:LPXTG-site transpeptidase (sortase) family protein
MVLVLAILFLSLTGFPLNSYPTMTLEIESIDLVEDVTQTTNELITIDGTVYTRAIVPETGIAWLKSTALPGAGDNILMIGHNRSTAFGRLDEVELGDEIIVRLNNTKHVYYVAHKIVVPNKGIDKKTRAMTGRLLGRIGSEQLTLLTCYGEGSTHRLLVIGEKLYD